MRTVAELTRGNSVSRRLRMITTPSLTWKGISYAKSALDSFNRIGCRRTREAHHARQGSGWNLDHHGHRHRRIVPRDLDWPPPGLVSGRPVRRLLHVAGRRPDPAGDLPPHQAPNRIVEGAAFRPVENSRKLNGKRALQGAALRATKEFEFDLVLKGHG